MTEFTERYKHLSDIELLEIIANYKNYQPLAVETAKKEIKSRNLSIAEVKKAELEIESNQQKKEKILEERKEKRDRIKGKIKDAAYTLFDTVNPIQNGIQTPERIIRLTSLIFGAISIYRIHKEYEMLRFMFVEIVEYWDPSIIEFYLPLIVLPVAIVLFWIRKKIGWILLSIFLTYSAISVITIFLMTISRQPSGITALDSLFPSVSPIVLIMTLIFFGGFLFLISKKGVREIYRISKQTMFLTIGLTIAINIVLIYSIIG